MGTLPDWTQRHNRQGKVPLLPIAAADRIPAAGLGSLVLCWMHYVRQGSFVSRDGTNIAAGRLCRERERREREEGLSRNGAPRNWGLQVGRLAAGWAAVRVSLVVPDMLLFVWDAWDRDKRLSWGTRIGMRIGPKWKGFCLRWERR